MQNSAQPQPAQPLTIDQHSMPVMGYVAPIAMTAPEKAQMAAKAVAATNRTAVLVIHGIGAQKPYETLDQFARGLRRFFGVSKSTQTVEMRQRKASPNTGQKDWSQSFIRMLPDKNSDATIDLYEYYWAPVITGRVSAYQSLLFLVMAALTPFQYLRDNLAVIDKARPTASNRLLWIVGSLFRELFRSLFIFIPMLALCGGLYWVLSAAVNEFLPTAANTTVIGKFMTWPLSLHDKVLLGATVVRMLMMAMCAVFLVKSAFEKSSDPDDKKYAFIYDIIIAALLILLLCAPLSYHWLAEQARNLTAEFLALAFPQECLVVAACLLLLVALSFIPKMLRSAWARGRSIVVTQPIKILIPVLGLLGLAMLVVLVRNIGLAGIKYYVVKWLVLPNFLHWRHIVECAVIAALAYVVRAFLTSAIGCLVVYLGADALSANYAARSQILHECTEMLVELISEDDRDWIYDRVLMAAHSLGSVLAYDSLNELLDRQNAVDIKTSIPALEKITGLLTFGCPLNKVIYFFRTRTTTKTAVLSQILYSLHPFRLRAPIPPESNPNVLLPAGFTDTGAFAKLRWFNAYSPFDLISGRMLFYRADKDVPVERGVTPWTAHLSYWDNDALYELFSPLLMD